MAHRILIFSIAIGADYSYEIKNSEIQAPAFFKHNNSFIATVLNSGPSYRITAVPGNRAVQSLQLMCHLYRQFGFSAIFPK